MQIHAFIIIFPSFDLLITYINELTVEVELGCSEMDALLGYVLLLCHFMVKILIYGTAQFKLEACEYITRVYFVAPAKYF